MKILCVADHVDPLVYSGAIKERFADIDLVLCAGDLPMEYVDFIVSSLNKPTFFVFGNHNLNDFKYYHKVPNNTEKPHAWNLDFSHGAVYAGFKVLREKKLLLAGASGCLRYNKGLCQYTNMEMNWLLIKMIPKLLWNKLRYGRFLDIFLTHAPPLGYNDKPDPCHKGFSSFHWFLRIFKPKYLIHGHIHLYDLQAVREVTFEKTKIINVYSHYVLNYEE